MNRSLLVFTSFLIFAITAAGCSNKPNWDDFEGGIQLLLNIESIGNLETDRNNANTIAQIINRRLDEFNVNIEKIVYDTDKEERFNLMLTSGDYPEVMTGLSKEDVIRLQDLGKIVDLAPFVDELGSNIKTELDGIYGRYIMQMVNYTDCLMLGACYRFLTIQHTSDGIYTTKWVHLHLRRQKNTTRF